MSLTRITFKTTFASLFSADFTIGSFNFALVFEKANKALETANQQIADMQKKNAIRDQREALMEKLKINAEQAKSVVKDNGSLDYDALGKITAEKETAAAQAKEQEIANNSENPGGGTAGGENKKTADVENAEKISFGKPAESAEAKDHYVL